MKTEKRKKGKYIALAVIAALLLIFAFLATRKIEKVTYEGNERLTDEELNSRIFGESLDYNPIIFWIKNLFGKKVEIPFVEEYDVEMESITSIKITVYEKSITGYISYMNTCMYFDKDGIVVENSMSEYEDVPEITGIKFDNIILHEKIPVKNKKIFSLILNVTQMVDKYNIPVKKINISEELSATLYINSFRVALGNDGDYGKKIAELSSILPNMEDIPGELDMREYNKSETGYVFRKDKK
ncbi:MAG: cell division protein FtsQ/DivIB [Lachnospiraceae bacterium]